MLRGHLIVQIGVAALLMASVCHSQRNLCFQKETPSIPSQTVPVFLRGVEDFGLSLFRQLVTEKTGSIFMSPYSLWSVLTLAYFGAEGRTGQQLQQALNLQSKSGTFNNWTGLKSLLHGNSRTKSGTRFKSTNRAYFSDTLKLHRCLRTILFELRRIDFTQNKRAKDIINHDVNITTEGKIENFIDFLPRDTEFVLINAVYFKGLWESPFKAEKTRLQEFQIPPGETAGIVQMMVQVGIFGYGRAPSLGATILELPYEKSAQTGVSAVSMFLILPDTWDVNRVIAVLNKETFDAAVSQMKDTQIEVGLPRFKMTTKINSELKSALRVLGITDLFQPGVANLTGFVPQGGLFTDEAIHEATVEINEEGTVAAAASGLVNTRFGGPPPIQFYCNRPFLFLITNKVLGITLFAGKVEHPADLEELRI